MPQSLPGLPARLGRTDRTVAGRALGLWRRTPLRLKLVATLLLLVIVALGGSEIVGVATMQAYLTGRVDSQLRAVAEHPISGLPVAGAAGASLDGDGANDPQRLPSAFVVALTDSTGALAYGPTSELLDGTEPLPRLPHFKPSEAPDQAEHTFTTGAVSGDRQWRVLAMPATLSDGSAGTLLVAQSLGDVEGTIDRLTALLAGIGAIAVLVVAGVGYLIVRASLRPLRRVEDTAAMIAAGDLTRRVPTIDPRTEVGQLSAALNTMLTDIESAFADRQASEDAARRSEDRMRRFIADASHELRTPLTSIRGFAELYRQGAATREPEVRRLMGRIESEATRMAMLVEDLLVLARLDRQRPLLMEPVDLLALAADAVHDAQAVDPSRMIRLELGNSDPPPIVSGDERRLRQMLANLVGNALQHTPAGTPVTVRIGTDLTDTTPVALLAVVDHGPGIAPEDTTRIFERFYRTDRSRNRDDGGSGLGLSIVVALVAAHAGRVQVTTTPGGGACFSVVLPLATTTSV